MTDLAIRGNSTDLTIDPGQTFFTDKQVAALRQLGVDRASNADLAIFFHQAYKTGLDPFARQIYMIERQGKQTIQTGIDGFRLVARRSTDRAGGAFGYEDTLWCGEDGRWTDVWLSKAAPAAAKVTVIRDGQRYPAVALWTEYVGTKRDGSVTQMWSTKSALMLAKCAEALALRKAFPQDLSGLYTSEEMSAADNVSPALSTPGRQVSAPVADRSGMSRLRSAVQVGEPAAPVAPDSPVDVVDGELIATPAQRTAVIAALAADGVPEDRASILASLSERVGREVSGTGDLTADEAEQILLTLGGAA